MCIRDRFQILQVARMVKNLHRITMRSYLFSNGSNVGQMLRFILISFPIFLMSSSWAENELNRMALDEKIGQLFVIPACPERELDHWADWLKLLKDSHIGGAIVKQSDPINQIKFLTTSKKNLSFLSWLSQMRNGDLQCE